MRFLPRQRRHEGTGARRGGGGGGRPSGSGGDGGRGRRRRGLDDEVGGLLTPESVTQTVDLVLQGHEHSDDV